MLVGLTLLLLFQLLGEVIVGVLQVPVPGPVLGMLLLFVALWVRGGLPHPDGQPARLEATATGLLRYLGLLFVPAGTGIIVHLDLLRQEWLALGVTLALSIVVALVVTGWTMRLLLRLTRKGGAA
jgi:holin-like protein